MRIDPPGSQIASRIRDPRIAIGIIYPTGSIYLTNRTGLSNVPGNVVQGVVTDISSSSQTLVPDKRRTTIGTLTFSAVDLDGDITDEIRTQLLSNDRGIRRREVRVYTGDTDDFNDFVRVETYVIDGVERDGQTYRFSCSDRSREQRVEIFDQAKTRLDSTITASDATINVLSTAGFDMLAHTAAFSDAPSSTVGYFRIKKTGEIVRYTGTTSTSFTGCTRAVFNTLAQAVEVTATEDSQKPEIEEFIYLEMPGPQLDYAIKTGVILGTANTLPATWHMGIDVANVDDDQYDAIGTDLYDPADPTDGMILRFTHLAKTDGKRFCEEQLHVPMGTFSPVSTMGVLGLRRVASLVGDSSPVAILYSHTARDYGRVVHQQSRVINQIVINWNFNGSEFTRTNIFYNAESIGDGETGHGPATPLVLDLKGLHVSQHSTTTLNRIADYYFERYGSPPIEITVGASRDQNCVEIGDVVRAVFGGVRDYTALAYLDRAFEVQSRRVNWGTGDLQFSLFGSTGRVSPDVGGGTGAVLDDAWYSSAGTELSTVLTIAGGAVTANGTLTGGSDARTAVFYYLGNLTINAGVTVTIGANVQLRVRGTLTINGAIDGAGGGIAAIADTNVVSSAPADYPAILSGGGYIGATRSGDGIYTTLIVSGTVGVWSTLPGVTLQGANASLPRLDLAVESGALVGLPSELRGAPGAYGAPVVSGALGAPLVRSLGGAGGDGGAGLLLICRGLAFGVSGQIDLSGDDGSAPAGTSTVLGVTCYGGGGAGGAPGALYVILDGDDLAHPDLSSAFIATQGASPVTGTPMSTSRLTAPTSPATGHFAGFAGDDHFQASNLVQYVPSGVVGESEDEVVPAPTSLAVTGNDIGALFSWTSPPSDRHDFIEVWRATTNDRTGAVRIFNGRAGEFFDTSASAVTRYFWVRAGSDRLGYSEWHPTSSTGGVSASYGGATGQTNWTPILTNVTRSGNTFTKTGGSATTWSDASVYSQEGYVACLVGFRASQIAEPLMVGLNTDPTTDHNYTSIDYALYCSASGGGTNDLQIYESGNLIGTFGTYATSDQLSISYDGLRVRYYRNGTLLRTVALVGARLFLDSTFYNVGAAINSVAFGAIAHVLAHAVGWAADSQGKPAGVRLCQSTSVAIDRTLVSLSGSVMQIGAVTAPDGVGFGLPAIPVDPAETYTLYVRHRSSGASADGLYVRFYEDDAALATGKTHIGEAASAEAVVQDGVSLYDVASNLPMPGTTAVEQVFTYTPTAGTKFASLVFYNWDPASSVTYYVEWCALTKAGSNVDLLPGVLPPVDTFGLNQEAATSVYSEFNDEELNIALAGVVVLSKEDVTELEDCSVFATLTFDVDSDGDNGGSLVFWAEIDGVGIVALDPNPLYVMDASTDARLMFQFQFDVSAGQTWSVFFEANSNVSNVVDIRDARLEINVIRR